MQVRTAMLRAARAYGVAPTILDVTATVQIQDGTWCRWEWSMHNDGRLWCSRLCRTCCETLRTADEVQHLVVAT
jgi:hypothetical protein